MELQYSSENVTVNAVEVEAMALMTDRPERAAADATSDENRVVQRQEVTKPGRGIRVVRLKVSSQQLSSVSAALRYGRKGRRIA
jgi:hypothetical protein